MRRAKAAATAATALAALAGCGGAGQMGPLRWDKPPLVFRAEKSPTDRVLIGTVRNRSSRDLNLEAKRLTVRDRNGQRLRAFAVFAASYAHGLYGAFQRPHPLPPGELRRLGFVVTIPAGHTAPLVVAFRLLGAARPPLRVDYGTGSLFVPSRVRSTTTRGWAFRRRSAPG